MAPGQPLPRHPPPTPLTAPPRLTHFTDRAAGEGGRAPAAAARQRRRRAARGMGRAAGGAQTGAVGQRDGAGRGEDGAGGRVLRFRGEAAARGGRGRRKWRRRARARASMRCNQASTGGGHHVGAVAPQPRRARVRAAPAAAASRPLGAVRAAPCGRTSARGAGAQGGGGVCRPPLWPCAGRAARLCPGRRGAARARAAARSLGERG
jgi:hypothetical protein